MRVCRPMRAPGIPHESPVTTGYRKVLDNLAAMWADPVIRWLLSWRDFQPFADFVIAHPPETADSSWSKVAAIVEVKGLLAAVDAQALEGVERPNRERKAP